MEEYIVIAIMVLPAVPMFLTDLINDKTRRLLRQVKSE